MQYPYLLIGPATGLTPNSPGDIVPHLTLMDEVQAAPKFTVDQNKVEELSDGSASTASETISLETGTFRVSRDYYELLRSLHGRLVDIMLLDVTVPESTIITAVNLRLEVGVLAQNDESAIIRLKAERETSAPGDIAQYFTLKPLQEDGCLQKFIVFYGQEEFPGALAGVTISKNQQSMSTGTTNADGEVLFLLSGDQEYTINVSLPGWTWEPLKHTPVPHALNQLRLVTKVRGGDDGEGDGGDD